ncbi:MAG: phosphatase PAP2 family protein [Candidatus Cloacimonetes bacterium]|nr:phosphatase PAP2 family protein [Candidatus Cloacimonadota bacterium]
MKKRGSLPIDWLTYGYIIFNLIYISLGRNRVPDAGKHLGILLAMSLFIYVLIRLHHEKSGWLLSFLRHWYPLIFFTYFFELSTIVNLVVFPEFIDPFFMRIDELIFGYQPAVMWGQMYDNIILSELLYFSYFSYYLVVPGIAFLLYFTKREFFERYVFTLSFVFYLCYLTYSFLPVAGGKYINGIQELITTYEGGPFQHIMAFIYRMSDHTGSAFPSSHVAITIVVNIAALQYFRKIGYWLLPLSLLLSISTIYCHYHYFIDTIFGLFYGVGFYFVGAKIFDNIRKRQMLQRSTLVSQETLIEKEKNGTYNS